MRGSSARRLEPCHLRGNGPLSSSQYSHSHSVLIRAVEPEWLFFIISGNIDPDKLMASKEALKEALRTATDRPNMVIGDIMQTTNYRCACSAVFCTRADGEALSRVFAW